MDRLRFFTSWPVRERLLLLLLVVFLPAFGIIVASGLNQRKEEIARLRDNALLLVQSLAVRQEEVAVNARTFLNTLAQVPEVQRLDAKTCNRHFRELRTRYPFYSAILAASPDGSVFAASMPLDRDGLNVSHRKDFKDALRTRGFSAGEYVDERTGDVPSLGFAMPVLDANDKPIAVVMAAFNLREYARFLSEVNLPAGYAITITDHKGIRLIRLPENNVAAPGTTMVGDVFGHISAGLTQGFYDAVGKDGTDRTYAFKKVSLAEDSPPYAYVVAGMAKGRILHRENLRMFRNLSLLGIATLIALFLSWIFGHFILVRPMSKLVASVQRFGKGELDIRTGLPHTSDELGRLALAFDNMASELQRKHREREDARQALNHAYAQLETRVQERTAELSASNAALTAEVGERKRVERALRESELKYRELVQDANSVILRMDISGRITFFNDFAQRFFGYTEEEILRQEAIGTIFPEYDSTGRDVRELIEDIGREPDRYVNTVSENIRRNGDRVWIAWTNRPVRTSKGRVTEILCIGNDITDRKRMEEMVRRSESSLAGAQRIAHIGSWEWDVAAKVARWSDETYRIFGLAPGEAKEDWEILLGMIHPEDRARVDQALSDAASGTRECNVEYRIILRDKTEKVIHARAEVIRDGNGKPVLMRGTVHDITEHKKAEAQLRESEERYRVAIEHSNDAVALGWGDRYIYANRRFLEIFGYDSLEEVLGKESSCAVHPDDRERVAEHLEEGRRGGPVPRYEFKGIRKDGATIYVEASVADVTFLGQSVGLAYLRDITERKRAEEALRERERELENKSASLEEANTALKVLLSHRDEDRRTLESMILANVKELVFPYLEKLQGGQLSDIQKTYLSIVVSSLNDIVSPFLQKMTSVYSHFTPTEVQVSNLVKSGKTSKEIAQLLNVCTGTVDAHRNNIRSKLGLSNKSVNLQTYLQSM